MLYWALQAFSFLFFSFKSKGWRQPYVKQWWVPFFQQPLLTFCLCHSPFCNSYTMSNCFIILTFCMVIWDQWSLMLLLQLFGGAMNHTHMRWQTIHKCVRSDWPFSTSWPFTRLSPSLRPPYCLKYYSIEVTSINGLQVSRWKEESHASHSKSKTTEFSEEARWQLKQTEKLNRQSSRNCKGRVFQD